MIAHLDAVELEALLKDFHLLTGIKIAVFDTEGNELIACPSPTACSVRRCSARPTAAKNALRVTGSPFSIARKPAI